MPEFRVGGPYTGLPNRYMVDGPRSAAGWDTWYRVDWCLHVASNQMVWNIENHQGRLIDENGRLGKRIIAAVEAHKQKENA